MKNSKKIVFEKEELEKFLSETNLILKSNALSRIVGGQTSYIKSVYANYAESTFVNNIVGPH